jgi:flagellar motor protein MotB
MNEIYTFLFNVAEDTTAPTPEREAKIKSIVDAFNANISPNKYVQVDGAACTTPIFTKTAKEKWGSNAVLSAYRAVHITNLLIKAGIPSEKIEGTYYGDRNAIGAFDKSICRRVDVSIDSKVG